jgi:Tfp pilus assembly protein PilV
MFLKDSKGFAYIDFIIGVVILGIAVVPVISILSNLRMNNNQVLFQSRAVTYTNSIMQHIRARPFDNVSDFNGFNNTDWSGIQGFSAFFDYDYSVTTSVYYVDPAINWLTVSVTPTNFKRIFISVDHANMNVPIEASSIVSNVGFYFY